MTLTFDFKFCNLLKKSYNAHLLNKLDEESRTTVQNICRKLVDMGINIGNIPLLQVMYNTTLSPLPTFDNISGPCSITLFQSETHNKTIYVIGEAHCSRDTPSPQQCPSPSTSVAELFDTIARTSKTFLDIYIEFPPSAKYGKALELGLGLPTGYIGEIYDKESKCFLDNALRLSAACKTSRWHFSDVRLNDEGFHNHGTIVGKLYSDIVSYALKDAIDFCSQNPEISSKLSWSILSDWCKVGGEIRKPLTEAFYGSYISYGHIDLPGFDKLIIDKLGIPKPSFEKYERQFNNLIVVIGALENEQVKEVFSSIRNNNFKKLFDVVEEQFRSIHYIEKEIGRSTAKDYIQKFYVDEFNQLVSKYGDNASKNLKDFCDMGDDTYYRLLLAGRGLYILLHICSLKMDTYLLARIFKEFKVSKEDDQPSTPSNIITYTGNVHSRNYRKFLSRGIPGFHKVAESFNSYCRPDSDYDDDSTGNCCLNLKNFPQPFFSESYSSY